MASKQFVKPVPRPEAATSRFSVNLKLMLLLGAVSFMVYANTLKNGFVLDDSVMLVNNSIVAKGISAIPELLSTPHQRGFIISRNDEYRPLSLIMFSVIYQFFGKDPAPYHFMNVLLFAGCVILLFLFLDKLFERKKTIVAFLATLLFALHPLHTEVVANIKSGDEILCFFFAFLSLNVFIVYSQTGKISRLLLGTFCFFLSLLSKETGVTFLAIVPMIFFFYRNEQKKRSVYITLSVVLSVIVFITIRTSVLKFYDADHMKSIDIIENALTRQGLSFESRMATAIFILGYYVKLLFIPYPLTFDYSFSTIPYVHFSNSGVLISLAIYIFLAVYGIVRLVKNRKDPYAFGILFFLVTIALFSNIFFLIKATLGERFMFFPSAGFCLCLALLIEKGVGKRAVAGLPFLKQPNVLLILIPLCLIYAIITFNRNNDWSDNYTLYSTDIQKAPDNSRINYFLGDYYLTSEKHEADPVLKMQETEKAISWFVKTLSIYPYYYNAQCDLGVSYFDMAVYDSAIACYKRAITMDPKGLNAVNNLTGLYVGRKRYREAIDAGISAIKDNPGNVIVYANTGYSYLNLSMYDSAIYYLNKGILADPGFKGSYGILSLTYGAMHNMDSARKYDNLAQTTGPGF